MLYVVFFLAGAVIVAISLIVWYLDSVSKLRRLQLQVKARHDQQRSASQKLSARRDELERSVQAFNSRLQQFESQKVAYDELVAENDDLKQDLFNLSVQWKKTERDHKAILQQQEASESKANELAKRYLAENVSWIGDKLTPKNFTSSKNRLTKALERCRSIGFEVTESEGESLIDDLRVRFEQAVRDEFHREEQARIRAQIREEERLAKEIDKQITEAQREQTAIEEALAQALVRAKDEYSAEVEHLRERLREAEAKAERAKSRAEMTKSGHVYVISNLGSFGEGVYKIGMTRRLEPMERVKELGDASVPFPFDVHMMLSCDDAPSLENALHRELHRHQINKVNPRKEFFRVNFEEIRRVAEAHNGEVDYVADQEALQYRESLEMSEKDQEYVDGVVQSLIDEQDGYVVDD